MMVRGFLYLVTKGSDDGTFEVGDVIQLLKDDAILCRSAGGWVVPENVPEAMQGVEYEVMT
jgi:hypothetical protein